MTKMILTVDTANKEWLKITEEPKDLYTNGKIVDKIYKAWDNKEQTGEIIELNSVRYYVLWRK